MSPPDVIVYDTTLRDGMQGEGMSLSVEEKVRVARILDELGVPMIEAGFPTSNPKELELFERLGEAGLTAAICAFGMTRRRGVAAEEDAALRVLAESWTPVSTLVGKTWGLHLEKVVKVDRDENLRMIEESVAYLVASGKRVIYDAEHFFDGFRDDSGVRDRVPAGRTGRRRRERDDVRHQRRVAAAPGGGGRPCRARRSCRTLRWGSTRTTTPSARWRTRWPGSPRARGWCRAR